MTKKGFTLIELIVVIAIIGLLTTGAMAAVGSLHSKGRDAKRLSDLRAFGTALEMFKIYNLGRNNYPTNNPIILGKNNAFCLNELGWQQANCANPYMAQVPADPQDSKQYLYEGDPQQGETYLIKAELEGTANGLSGKIKLTPDGISKM